MNKFEEEFDYLIKLFGKVLIRQIEVEEFEKHREIFLKKYSEKQQAEVPEFVDEWLKQINFRHLFDDISKSPKKIRRWINKNNKSKTIAACEFIATLKINGYTVYKEKYFYLKNKLTGGYIEQDCYNGTRETYNLHDRTAFTQQEIDSMETGSYEQIEVK